MGMLLPGSQAAQLEFAQQAGAVGSLMSNVVATEEKDCRALAQNLLQLLSSNPESKQAVAAALRVEPL